ncbi:large subunit ribosomal protein L21e [Nematocida major]|uniref:large subunit ribosomal protein L21e n=1 Tax=Nematocida major TaxID=1912982 RepID=UPI0020080A54|nr:large subunit ribosomal protein L21e [Nematocida major]KAH9386386.1 large subunit ribosomal protein L21e [Nematocida major]
MRSKGYRSNTRSVFKKDYKQSKRPQTTTLLNQYQRGDYVDISVDSGVHKGMPHKTFVGRTGRVYAVFKTSVGIALTKKRGNSIVVKKVIARIEHVRPSQCQKEKLARDEYREKHGVAPPKPMPEGLRPAFTISLEENTPVVLKSNTHYAM